MPNPYDLSDEEWSAISADEQEAIRDRWEDLKSCKAAIDSLFGILETTPKDDPRCQHILYAIEVLRATADCLEAGF